MRRRKTKGSSAREIASRINAYARECLVCNKPDYAVVDLGESLIHQFARDSMKPAPPGRTIVEMDTVEYERMRASLGEQWEWQGLVRIADGRPRS